MSDHSVVPDKQHHYTNALIHESSPYLLQHAHNPVDWLPWGETAFKKAREEDKLVLVSIGYSSCHWCHVMEHESFENEEVAALMNTHFVCIKVDREERPDVDDIYMTAVQLMNSQGGWPLNCFTLPDGRPVFGGTYFPRTNWIQVLRRLNESYCHDKDRFVEYAEKLTRGIAASQLIETPATENGMSPEKLDEMMVIWKRGFDRISGGNNRAPKFPMPNNYEMMMAYAQQSHDEETMQHVDLTLVKMARGGIYDQIGGGFSRYSTDMDWKVPHFEKMLYDNAQLISLYSKAYQRSGSNLYRQVVVQTIEWAKREMMTKEGVFYTALDADSEGEEGRFYTWSIDELREATGADYELARNYFSIGPKTEWEGRHILLCERNDDEFCLHHTIDAMTWNNKKQQIFENLLKVRANRIRPGLDDKSLTSWNALMVSGLLDAYIGIGDEDYLELALKNANWLVEQQTKSDGGLYHSFKDGISKIDGFMDDYSFTISAFVKLYEVTFDEGWIQKAKSFTDYAIAYFYDQNSGMFFFTSAKGEQLIARKMEIADNVIPSSNSVMAICLYKLGYLLENEDYRSKAKQMLANVYDGMEQYGSAYSNWGQLVLIVTGSFYQLAITGPDWKKKWVDLSKNYLPNVFYLGGEHGNLPALKGKFSENTMIYVCVDSMCKKPVSTADEALKQIV